MAILKAGDSQRFDYTGTVQQFVVPADGLYKLEVWGGKGGGANGGNGGYASGYIDLAAGTVLYIVCGGGKEKSLYVNRVTFNGGGRGICVYGFQETNGNGGGATHIALVGGLLANIGYAQFVTQKQGLIVAGGGGGGSGSSWSGYGLSGGAGGGLDGLMGTVPSDNANTVSGVPGNFNRLASQTSGGYAMRVTADGDTSYGSTGAFGVGGDGIRVTNGDQSAGGGGGGLYGGSGASVAGYRARAGGGGGSGYIGGVPAITYRGQYYAPSTTAGINNGTGYAIITLIAKSAPAMYLGSLAVEALMLGDVSASIALGDMTL